MNKHTSETAANTEILEGVECAYSIPEESLCRHLGDAVLTGLTLAQKSEYYPLQDVEEGLKRAIVGQEEAIDGIISALSRGKFRNPNRPIANLLFLGPTGVGKSEMAKELARQLHDDDDDAFLRIDCSSFSLGHVITALVGAPPSYVGHEQTPLLDPDIIEQEKSVILFDEIEKGSPELWDLLLQIMDEGELLVTGTGKTVSFRNSIIIMTSNLGSSEMMRALDPKKVGFQSDQNEEAMVSKEKINEVAISALKEHFRPEFINRLDRKVVFTPLDDEQLGEVLNRYLGEANKRYLNAGIQLLLSEELNRELVTSNRERYQYGARPILREYDHRIESRLSVLVDSQSIPEGSQVYAVINDRITAPLATEPNRIDFYYEHDEDLQSYIDERNAEKKLLQDAKVAEVSHSTEIDIFIPPTPPTDQPKF